MVNLSEQLKPTNQRKKANSENKQVNEQVVNKHCTSSGTGTEQALVSSINNINSTNIVNFSNIDEQQKTIKKDEFKNQSSNCHPELVEGTKKKLREKKGTNEAMLKNSTTISKATVGLWVENPK
jgi:hypothetical protein